MKGSSRQGRFRTAVVRLLVLALLTAGSVTGYISAAETGCAALAEEAHTFAYQGINSSETVLSTLETYRDRLAGCSAISMDGEGRYLLATIDFLHGRVALDQGEQRLAEEKLVSVINEMERLIDEQNETSGVLTLLAESYITRTEYKGKFYGMRVIGDVRRLLEEALSLNPLNYRAHLSLARYYLNAPAALGGDRTKAREHAEIAGDSEADYIRFDALLLMSEIYSKLGADGSSEDAMARATQIFPSNEKVR